MLVVRWEQKQERLARNASGASEGLLGGWGGGVGAVHEEHIGGVGAQRDGVLLEGLEDAAAEFAEDGVFLVDGDVDADGVGDDAAGDGVDAGNFGIGDGGVFEGGVVADGEGGGAQDGEDVVGVGGGVDGEGEGGDGEVAGVVGDGGDLGVGDEVEGAVGSRRVVRRRLRSSTVPVSEASLTVSPTLYWFSMRMKMPLMMSLKRDWAPRPMPTPTTPAEASRGVKVECRRWRGCAAGR